MNFAPVCRDLAAGVFVATGEKYLRPIVAQARNRACADAARPAGNQRDLACQPFSQILLSHFLIQAILPRTPCSVTYDFGKVTTWASVGITDANEKPHADGTRGH